MSALNRIDMTGIIVGKLTVLGPGKRNGKTLFWRCQCACGQHVEVRGSCLRRENRTTSCGCERKRRARESRWSGFKDISGTYWQRLKKGAAARGLSFEIDIRYAWSLFQTQGGICSMSGTKLVFATDIKRRNEQQTASLDRIDSSRGYVKGNLRWIHKEINHLKTDLPDAKFIDWCRKISSFNNDKRADPVSHHSDL